jgi:hypothetical protein
MSTYISVDTTSLFLRHHPGGVFPRFGFLHIVITDRLIITLPRRFPNDPDARRLVSILNP